MNGRDNIGRNKAYFEKKKLFNYSKNSTRRMLYITDHVKAELYRFGKQWQNDELTKAAQDAKAILITLNEVGLLINRYTSLYLRAGKVFGYKTSKDDPSYNKICEYLQELGYQIKSQSEYAYNATAKMQDLATGGLGWSKFVFENGKFNYTYVNPKDVYWDPDDFSRDLSNSNFVCHKVYYSLFEIKQKYPRFSKRFEDMIDISNENTSESFSPDENLINEDDNQWTKGYRIKCIEVYSKEIVDYYETEQIIVLDEESQDIDRVIVTTFDEDRANQIARETNKMYVVGYDKAKVVTKQGTRIMKTVYCDDMLLENEPLVGQVPNQKNFPLLPVVLQLDHNYVPRGVVLDYIPLQDLKNLCNSKQYHLLGSKLLIVSDETSDLEKLRREASTEYSKKFGMISVKDPAKIQIVDHSSIASGYMSLANSIRLDAEKITGMHETYNGAPSNITENKAIITQTQNTLYALNFYLQAVDKMILSEANALLNMIKGTPDFKMDLKYFKDGKNKVIEITNQISLLDFEVYATTVSNFESSKDQQQLLIDNVLNNPNKELLLNSPYFLEKIGLESETASKMCEEFKRVTGQNQPKKDEMSDPNEEIL